MVTDATANALLDRNRETKQRDFVPIIFVCRE